MTKSQSAQAPIGVFDSGLGGLTVVRAIRERLPQEAFVHGRPLLSMGMSSDFEVAIEEGSDCVRVGSALFAGEESGR